MSAGTDERPTPTTGSPDRSTEARTSRPSAGARRHTAMLAAIVIMWCAVTGYFVGLSSPSADDAARNRNVPPEHDAAGHAADHGYAIPATSYAQLADAATGPNHDWTSELSSLLLTPYDPLAEVSPDHAQKLESLARREELRAFNGAPPTVPHPIDQITAKGCLACHGEGLRTDSLRVPRMPHAFYANCTQCHVEQSASQLAPAAFAENRFVGLPAPHAGPRAFAEAPPMIPHTTWLRNDCLSCHGRTSSPGMETTHPWRQNCLQCHAGSFQLDQVTFGSDPEFLPPPHVENSDE